MIVPWIRLVSRWATAAGLLILLPFLAPSLLLVSVGALLLRLGLLWNRSVRYELSVVVVNSVALPLVASSLWPNPFAGLLLALLALPWFEEVVRRQGNSFVGDSRDPTLWQPQVPLPGGWSMTAFGVRVVATLMFAALVGLLAEDGAIAISALALLVFIGALVALAHRNVPAHFLVVRPPTTRVLAGETVDVTVSLSAQTRGPLSIAFEDPIPLTSISPTSATLTGPMQVHVRHTATLAGPSTLRCRVRAIDPWGLTSVCAEADLVHVRVIPKAVYAAWLARRYLQEAQRGALAPVTVSDSPQHGSVRRGLEYVGARPYEPGDGLKDLFWKHTLKLQQYIVKERRDDWGTPVLIAANLATGTPEDADRLAYELLTSTLTLAQEGVPLSFAAYTDAEVVRVSPPLSPRPAVMAALELIERICIVPQPLRILESPQVLRLRRMISRLLETPSVPATRLARILTFEYRALEVRARAHPATHAIRRALAEQAPPITLLILSASQADTDVLDLTLERLRPLGVHPLTAPFGNGQAGWKGHTRPSLPTAIAARVV